MGLKQYKLEKVETGSKTWELPTVRNLFPGSDRGDVGTVKDIVGIFLATLTNQEVTID